MRSWFFRQAVNWVEWNCHTHGVLDSLDKGTRALSECRQAVNWVE